VAAGRILEWIDRAGYVCAVGWSGTYCVTAYVGNLHVVETIQPGELVEIDSRIIHTGRTSMQILVEVRSSGIEEQTFTPAMNCILVFVAVDKEGRPTPVRQWTPAREVDRILQGDALARVAVRQGIRRAMDAEVYSERGTTPQVVLQFLALPGVANFGGKVHGGSVLRWINEAAYACAASWTSTAARAVYSGGIHFHQPIQIGQLVELDARLIYLEGARMHISIQVRSKDLTSLVATRTTQCMAIFVDPDGQGALRQPRRLDLHSAEDRRLARHAEHLIELRSQLDDVPRGSLVDDVRTGRQSDVLA
jgi:4-hydroxybenzoyl-CoA thioesterase